MVGQERGTGRSGPLARIRGADEGERAVGFGVLRRRHFEESVPWRRFRSHKGQQHLSGSYWSATTGGFVVYESRLELARLLLADFEPTVTMIYAQPCLIEAAVEGRVRRHVPDFLLVSRDSGVEVVNVKPPYRLADPKIAQALAWPGALVRSHGWNYEVWSGADPVVVANVRFLAAFRRPWVVDQQVAARAWESVEDGEELRVAEHRLGGAAPVELVRPALLSLLWSGRLTTDLSVPLAGTSALRRAA